MLLNDFFKIIDISATAEKLTVQIQLDATHKIFDGHFPGNPVTPGVVQLQMVKEILEFHYKKDLLLIAISRCKFLQILNPQNTPIIFIHIEIALADADVKINATGLFDGTSYFKFSATYR